VRGRFAGKRFKNAFADDASWAPIPSTWDIGRCVKKIDAGHTQKLIHTVRGASAIHCVKMILYLMNSHSMRVQLTVWNVGVLALVLVLKLGVAPVLHVMVVSLLNSTEILPDHVQSLWIASSPPPENLTIMIPSPDGD
jgi:hypothetical protein